MSWVNRKLLWLIVCAFQWNLLVNRTDMKDLLFFFFLRQLLFIYFFFIESRKRRNIIFIKNCIMIYCFVYFPWLIIFFFSSKSDKISLNFRQVVVSRLLLETSQLLLLLLWQKKKNLFSIIVNHPCCLNSSLFMSLDILVFISKYIIIRVFELCFKFRGMTFTTFTWF